MSADQERRRGSGPAGLVRSRLLPRPGAPEEHLTVVVAPAGSGKTTLLTHRAAASDADVVRLRLEPSDRDPATFRRHLSRALSPLRPRCTDGDDPTTVAEALTGDLLVVVDDAHHVRGSEAERDLETFLSALPPTARTVLASRRDPQMNLFRHELGPVLLLDGDDLRFRTWEVERLFRDVYAEPLLPTDAATLTRRVGGWAAGLQMFHLSTRGRPARERAAAAQSLDGRLSLSQAYLARTVLAELPDPVREFLVRTCVFHTVTARHCDELLGITGSARHLRWLADRQAFTHSPDGGRTYRYHEALRRHLEIALVEAAGEAGARSWHARAGQVLEAAGEPADALRAYARAADWTAVRRMLLRVGGDVVDAGGGPWSDLLPDWLVAEEPWLLMAEGHHLVGQGRVDGAVALFRAAESHARHPSVQEAAHRARVLTSRWQTDGPRPDGLARMPHWSSALRDALRARPAAVAAAAGSTSGADGRLVRAVASLLAGDLAAAVRTLDDGVSGGGTVVEIVLDMLRAAVRIVADPADTADTADAADELEAAAGRADREDLGWLSRMARAATALTGNDAGIKEARRITEECGRDGDDWGALLAGACACLGSSSADRAPSGGGAHPDELRRVAVLARRLDAEVVAVWADALSARADVGTPGASERARAAAHRARLAGVPGACAVADAVAGGPDDGSDRIGIRCLGRFEIRLRDGPLDLTAVRPRVRSVLRLLALHAGEPMHRQTLLATFWPDSSRESATRNLHVALSSLRALLGTGRDRPRLSRSGDTYVLEPAPGTTSDLRTLGAVLADADRARSPAGSRATALRTALTLYTGDLLPEEGTAEWVVAERDRWRLAVAAAAAELAEAELAAGRGDAAVAAATRCVELDDCHDAGWRLLVTAYRRAGDPMAAARAERRYHRMLAELGVGAPRYR